MRLPELDTKPYGTLLAEALARIPSLTTQWTDFNPQDTGVMLLEMMAALTEMENFMVDQAGDEILLPFLRLVYGQGVCLEMLEETKARFVKDCATPVRAVTMADYEYLALHSPFEIEMAHARASEGLVTLTVYYGGKRQPDARQEQEFYRYMKARCLLGTRLEVCKAQRLRTRVQLHVMRDSRAGRAETVRAALDKLLAESIGKKELGVGIDMGGLLGELLSMPEILHIRELRVFCEVEGVWQEAYHYNESCQLTAAPSLEAVREAVLWPLETEILFE